MHRSLRVLASIVVMAASFAAATWMMRAWGGGEPAPVSLPGLQRSAPQPVPAPPPPAQAARAADTTRERASFTAAARAAELAEEAARADLEAAAGSVDEPLSVRVDLYLEALERALEASGDSAMLAHRAIWTEHFLRIEAVQAELAEAPPETRRGALAEIRRRMGFDDAEIERMASLDARREERWARGLAYLEERERLESTFDGEALEAELRHLRERTFGHEAKTIEREEASGFERFRRPRVYGRN